MIPSWMPAPVIDALSAGATVSCFDRDGNVIDAPAGLGWAVGASGVALNDLARIHAPIGLGIGAVSPAEIALAILGQIVATLRLPPADGDAAGANQAGDRRAGEKAKEGA